MSRTEHTVIVPNSLEWSDGVMEVPDSDLYPIHTGPSSSSHMMDIVHIDLHGLGAGNVTIIPMGGVGVSLTMVAGVIRQMSFALLPAAVCEVQAQAGSVVKLTAWIERVLN